MRKILAVLLAAVMLLMPMTGLAASPAEMLDNAWAEGKTLSTRVSFDVGNLPLDEETATLVKDLVRAVGFRTTADPSGKTQFALTMQNQDALAVGAEPAEGRIYINTPFLSVSTMSFSAEEAKVVAERLLDMLGEASGMSQSEIAEMKAVLAAGFDAGVTAGSAVSETVEMPEIDMSALMGVVAQVTASMESGAVTQQPAESCDEGVAYMKVTVTPEMVKEILTVVCDIIKTNPEAMNSLRNAGVAWELDGRQVSLEQFLDGCPAEVADELQATYGSIPVYVVTGAAGDVVYLDVVMTPVNGGDVEKLVYARKTGADAIVHNVKVLEGSSGMQFTVADACTENETAYSVDIYEVNGGTSAKVFGARFSQKREYGDTLSYENTSLIVTLPTGDSSMPFVSVLISASVRGEVAGGKVYADTNVSLGVDILGMDLVSVQVNTVADDTAIPSIAGPDDVRPGAMTDAEFADFANGCTNQMMTGLIMIMQLLPSSVLMALLG